MSQQSSALARVAAFARREQLFRRTGSVLLAVSGGADSTAALLLLRDLRDEFGFSLTAGHFDHQLRATSRDDLEHVRALCARLDVPFLSGEGDVRGSAARTRTGIEAAARLMRYQFLAFVAAEKRIEALATGHTLDDQAETVLLRIVRGTGVRGLRGMLASGPVPGSPGQRLIRPLLGITRADTEDVCRGAGVVPLVDESNGDPAYLRNRIRQETLPALRAVNPSIRASLAGIAQSAREAFEETERRSFMAQPKQRLPIGAIYERRALDDLPNEALTLVIEREAAFTKTPVDLNRTRIGNLRSVLKAGGGAVRFGETLVEASAGLVRIGPVLDVEPFETKPVSVPGITVAGPWILVCSLDPLTSAPGERIVQLDLDAIEGVLRFRPPTTGDRMRYHGLERNLADINANEKLPAWDRRSAVVLADRKRVHALVAASTAFVADLPPSTEHPLWVKLAGRPTR